MLLVRISEYTTEKNTDMLQLRNFNNETSYSKQTFSWSQTIHFLHESVISFLYGF